MVSKPIRDLLGYALLGDLYITQEVQSYVGCDMAFKVFISGNSKVTNISISFFLGEYGNNVCGGSI